MLGAVDRETKARIDSLLYELRSWDPKDPPRATVADLAKRFGLDSLVIKRVAESEGWTINGDGVPEPIAEDDTEPIDVT
jgi:hypothetical protein